MPIAATERTLRAILQYGIDPRGLREVKSGTKELDDALNELRMSAQEAAEPWQDLGAVISQYEALGMEFADMARGITDSIRGWAEQYVQVAGEADEVSQMWLETTKNLEAQQARLGGVAVQALVPLVNATAGVVEKAADLAEKYPEAMQIALGIGTAVVAAAAIQNAVTRGIRIFADAKLLVVETQRLLAAKIMRDAANKQMAAAATMGAASKERALLGLGGAAGKAGGIGGALAAAAPALAIGAAVVSVGAAGVAIKRFADNVGSKTDEMADHWDVFLTRSVGEVENAADLASRYNDAQRGVNEAYDEGGVIAAVFLDRQGLVNASQEKVQNALIKVAKGYDDYERAIGDLNNELGDSERAFELLDKATFEHRQELSKLWQSYREGNATLRELAEASHGLQGVLLNVAAMAQEMASTQQLMEPWQEYQDALEQATEDHAKEIEKLEGENKKELVKLDIETADEREKIQKAYDRDVLQLDVDTATERGKIAEREKEAVLKAEDDIKDERSKAMSSFQEELAEMEADYYASRAEAAADYGLEVARAEQDHQKEMRRMQEDSADRQRSAIRARDALALLEEVRSYQRDRGRAEEDYRIEAARRSEDFARQLAEMEINFQKQQKQREKAYQEELAALQERLDDEKQMLADQAEKEGEILENSRANQARDLYEQKTGEEDTLNESYERQTNDLASNLRDQQIVANNAYDEAVAAAENRWKSERQLRGIYLPGELAELDAHYQARRESLQAFMDQAILIVRPRGGSYPERQSGGYSAGHGLHMLGERGREFVMDAPTTRRAETLAGGGLTQDRLLAAMAGGRSTSIQLHQENTIYADNPDQVRVKAKEGALAALNEVLDKINK